MDHLVICRLDRKPDGSPGDYVIATRHLFSYGDAKDYAKTIARSREPRVINAVEWFMDYKGFTYA